MNSESIDSQIHELEQEQEQSLEHIPVKVVEEKEEKEEVEEKEEEEEKDEEVLEEQTSPELVTLIDVTNAKDIFIEQVKLQLIEQIKENTQDLDKTLLFTLLTTAMEIVETSDFKGSFQKDIVIQILISVLESDLVKSVHKDDLLLFLHNDASNIIDIIVDASKGKININNVENIEKVTTSLVACLFGCLKKNSQNSQNKV
jgi:hypothetical protein